MADVILSQTIPEAKVAKVAQGWFYIQPIPTVTDPETGEVTNGYTPIQWANELILRYIRQQAKRGLQKQAQDQAVAALEEDPDLVS